MLARASAIARPIPRAPPVTNATRPRRSAAREALAETNYDPNRLIDALFDPDGLGCGRSGAEETALAHVAALGEMAARERDGALVAAATMMLATSLGYAPGEVAGPRATP